MRKNGIWGVKAELTQTIRGTKPGLRCHLQSPRPGPLPALTCPCLHSLGATERPGPALTLTRSGGLGSHHRGCHCAGAGDDRPQAAITALRSGPELARALGGRSASQHSTGFPVSSDPRTWPFLASERSLERKATEADWKPTCMGETASL